jgi:putative Mg2+ transporter-C (MgtC) family protein
MLLSIYGFSSFVYEAQVRVDPARLAAQVISGIGFLGAGAILRNGNAVKGLTTAASVWVVAAIGLCVGAGFYTGALVCTFFVLISLYLLNKGEKHLMRHRRVQEVDLVILDQPGVLGQIASIFGQQQIQIANLRMNPADGAYGEYGKSELMQLNFSLKVPKPDLMIAALEQITSLPTVLSAEVHGTMAQRMTAAKDTSLHL